MYNECEAVNASGAEVVRGEHRGDPIMKPTGFLTNSPKVAVAMSRICSGTGGECSRPRGGKHRLCSGRHARDTAKYPRGLCRAVLKGITEQLKEDDLLKDGCHGIQVPDDDASVLREMYGPAQGYSGKCKDDLAGQTLCDDLVKQTRAKELAWFNQKGVCAEGHGSSSHRTRTHLGQMDRRQQRR